MPGGHPAIARLIGAERWPPIDPLRLEGVVLRRMVAYALDFCVVGLVAVFAAMFLLGVTILSIGLLSPSFALLLAIPAAYHTLTIGLTGATLGQRALGLVVVDTALQPPGLLQAFVQTVLFYLTVPSTGGLVLLLVFLFPRRCTLHDVVAGTQVLRRVARGGEILSPRAAP